MFLNVIVRPENLLVDAQELFAYGEVDWEQNEKQKTYFTNESFLPNIMKEIGLVDSISEVRRNQPKLCVHLTSPDFFKLKWGKKIIWFAVGEKILTND